MNEAELANSILQAAGNGYLDEVEALLAAGVSANICNHLGYTPLMSAARSYRVEIVEVLLDSGADPNIQCSDGVSALHCAVGETPTDAERQAECVRLILSAGANPDVMTDTGLTPLMNASWFGCNLAVGELLKSGANVDVEDKQGRTAADLARARGNHSIAEVLEAGSN